MRASLVAVLIAPTLAGCAVFSEQTPADPLFASPWAIDRQIARCRATQTGGTRVTQVQAGPVAVVGGVAAVSRTVTPETEACPAVLALTDDDVGEIRTLVQATGASARGLDTNWETRAGARREIRMSVYPDNAQAGRSCRLVAAHLLIPPGRGVEPVSGPLAASLEEQRLCRNAQGAWEPG